MLKIKIQIILLLISGVSSFGFDAKKIMNSIESILSKGSEVRGITIREGVFDSDGYFWLSWIEYDIHPRSSLRDPFYWTKPHPPHFVYWYIQRFTPNGAKMFPAIEMSRGKIYADDGFWGYPIYPGDRGDVYYSSERGYLGRVDAKGNNYLTTRPFRSLEPMTLFFDKKGTLYLFTQGYGGASGFRKCTKAKIEEPLPIYLYEQEFPELVKPEALKYLWLYSPTIRYCDSSYAIFISPPIFRIPPDWTEPSWDDTARINVYRVSLPDMMSIDTSSFRIRDALFKKIKGCKLRIFCFR